MSEKPLDVLLGKNIKRYFDAGDAIVAKGDRAIKAAFEAVLATDDTFVRSRVEHLGLCVEQAVGRDREGHWIRYFAEKLDQEARRGVAEELIWRCVHLGPRIDANLREGGLCAEALFGALLRFDHKGFRSEASRAASYLGGARFDQALFRFVDGLAPGARRRFQTLVKLANKRR